MSADTVDRQPVGVAGMEDTGADKNSAVQESDAQGTSTGDSAADGAAKDGAEFVKLSPAELAESVQEEQDSASA